jgi:MATE family multidrug resistance protein
LKGIDKKNLVTYTTLIVYYIFGTRMQQSSLAIPLVLVFTFGWGFDLGVTGIWLAFGVANLMLLVMYLFSLLTTDWHVQ